MLRTSRTREDWNERHHSVGAGRQQETWGSVPALPLFVLMLGLSFPIRRARAFSVLVPCETLATQGGSEESACRKCFLIVGAVGGNCYHLHLLVIQRSEIIYPGPHSGLGPYGDLTLGLLAALGHSFLPWRQTSPQHWAAALVALPLHCATCERGASSVLESLPRAGGISPARNKRSSALETPDWHLSQSHPLHRALHRSLRCLVCERGL